MRQSTIRIRKQVTYVHEYHVEAVNKQAEDEMIAAMGRAGRLDSPGEQEVSGAEIVSHDEEDDLEPNDVEYDIIEIETEETK